LRLWDFTLTPNIMTPNIKRYEDRDKDDSRSKFSEMVDFSTLALVEVTNGQALLSFTPFSFAPLNPLLKTDPLANLVGHG
jgi:hypothetical protein